MTTRASATALLHRLQRGLSDSLVELVYIPHERWPLPHPHAHINVHSKSTTHPQPLRISVLDSSFNPPTLAHLALANSPRPRYSHVHTYSKDSSDIHLDYDAKLLLLSVRNADKLLKPNDATYVQRLEMMLLLAKDITHNHHSPTTRRINEAEVRDDENMVEANVAVAIIDEPTFVGKSSTLLAFLQKRLTSLTSQPSSLPSSQPPPSLPAQTPNPTSPAVIYKPELTFLLGFDTLERLFSQRYYPSTDTKSDSRTVMLTSLRKFFSPSPLGDDSRVVCARRVSAPLSSLPPIPMLLQHGLDDTPAPSAPSPTKDTDGRFELDDSNKDPNSKKGKTGSDLLRKDENGKGKEKETMALAKEFIASERVVMIDIGEDERTFSSSAVREMINASSGYGPQQSTNAGKESRKVPDERCVNGQVDWTHPNAGWRRLLPGRVAEYVIKEGLYVHADRDAEET